MSKSKKVPTAGLTTIYIFIFILYILFFVSVNTISRIEYTWIIKVVGICLKIEGSYSIQMFIFDVFDTFSNSWEKLSNNSDKNEKMCNVQNRFCCNLVINNHRDLILKY